MSIFQVLFWSSSTELTSNSSITRSSNDLDCVSNRWENCAKGRFIDRCVGRCWIQHFFFEISARVCLAKIEVIRCFILNEAVCQYPLLVAADLILDCELAQLRVSDKYDVPYHICIHDCLAFATWTNFASCWSWPVSGAQVGCLSSAHGGHRVHCLSVLTARTQRLLPFILGLNEIYLTVWIHRGDFTVNVSRVH